MSRFADPAAVSTLDLGACQCPGTPHERDEAVVRWQLSGSALARIGTSQTMGRLTGDPFMGYRQMAHEALVSWTLLDKDGDPAPLTTRTIEELDVETLTAIAEQCDAVMQNNGELPKASSAPSRASSRGSASPIPTKIPTPGTSTLPSGRVGLPT